MIGAHITRGREFLPSTHTYTKKRPYENLAIKWLSASLEESPHQELNQPASWFRLTNLQNSEKINFGWLSHPVCGIVYGCSSWLMQDLIFITFMSFLSFPIMLTWPDLLYSSLLNPVSHNICLSLLEETTCM